MENALLALLRMITEEKRESAHSLAACRINER